MSSTPPPPPPLPGPDPSWNQAPTPAPAPVPPPPPGAGAPPPPPSFSAPPTAPAYGLGEVATKPPRPQVRVGALLMIIGAVGTIICSFLPWMKAEGKTLNGSDDYFTVQDGTLKILQDPGARWIAFSVVVLGLGIALYLAGRVLAVAIIGIVVSAVAAILVIGSLGIVSDYKDLLAKDGTDASLQFGVYLGVVMMLMSLGGAIAATSKRRR